MELYLDKKENYREMEKFILQNIGKKILHDDAVDKFDLKKKDRIIFKTIAKKEILIKCQLLI